MAARSATHAESEAEKNPGNLIGWANPAPDSLKKTVMNNKGIRINTNNHDNGILGLTLSKGLDGSGRFIRERIG
jgi:hypothetical protein